MKHHSFCRKRLANILPLVRSMIPKTEIKRAWAWGSGKHFEFHGPDQFFLQCGHSVDCKWSAMAEGWEKWCDKYVNPEGKKG